MSRFGSSGLDIRSGKNWGGWNEGRRNSLNDNESVLSSSRRRSEGGENRPENVFRQASELEKGHGGSGNTKFTIRSTSMGGGSGIGSDAGSRVSGRRIGVRRIGTADSSPEISLAPEQGQVETIEEDRKDDRRE